MSAMRTRRDFLADVGRGTLVATVGSALAVDLGLAPAYAGSPEERLTFGALEPLVALMQETPADKILGATVGKLREGTCLKDLLAAAALANARTFGGEDYVGFHTVMALAPAFHMSCELPEERKALPVLKVIYRNANRIQEFGGKGKEVLKPVDPMGEAPSAGLGEAVRQAVRDKDLARAERTFLAAGSPEEAFDAVLFAVEDNTEVHRTVLPYRSWDLLGLIGKDQAKTLLRQAVHYCVKSEKEWNHTEEQDRPRVLLPKLLDQYKLVGKAPGTKQPDDAWVESLSKTIFEGSPEQAADAAAAALAEGFIPASVGEAISLAANQLVLRDHGRYGNQIQPNKPAGSVHGDSIGVHACDSANAWRNMAAASGPRNAVACLILGAYQVAYDRTNRGGEFLTWTPWPRDQDNSKVHGTDAQTLLSELKDAVTSNDQGRACAIAHRYGQTGSDPKDVFNLLLRYAVSEDGALHAEKFYRTVREEFASTRPAFRWRQVVALARVTASEYGRPAPGYAEACELLKV